MLKTKKKEENIKKLADINSKLEGGAKNKLMSFMRNDSNTDNKLEEFSKKENENKDEMINKEKEKENVEKPKKVRNSLKKLRGLDI